MIIAQIFIYIAKLKKNKNIYIILNILLLIQVINYKLSLITIFIIYKIIKNCGLYINY